MSQTYLRWRQGEERRTPPGRFQPLHKDHPIVGSVCTVCWELIDVDQVPALFVVGPDTPDAAAKHDAHHWYSALAVGAHEHCLYPEQP